MEMYFTFAYSLREEGSLTNSTWDTLELVSRKGNYLVDWISRYAIANRNTLNDDLQKECYV